MKVVFLSFILSLSVYSKGNFGVGRNLEYSVRYRGISGVETMNEEIKTVDNEFESHQRVMRSDQREGHSKWVYNDEAYSNLLEITQIFKNCENGAEGKYEWLSVNNKSYLTCMITRNLYFFSDIVLGNLSFDLNNSIVWIGEGPYNGLFKVIDKSTHTLFKLTSFN